MSHLATKEFTAASIAVLTVSDTRNESTDTSGGYLVEALTESGHQLLEKKIVIDDPYKIRAIVSQWIADEKIEVVLITGGTGFTARDTTPEAVSVFLLNSAYQVGGETLESR